jgi:osmotically-inducible protein OsmY
MIMKSSRITRQSIALAVGLMMVGAVYADDRDDRIEDAFKNSHVYRTELRKTDLSVDAESGVVTLKGKVDNEDQKRLAEDTARSLPGVVRVDNQVRVTNEPKESSDEWIALKVRGALLFHRNVSATNTNVAVHDGVVTLTGTAKTDAEKALASEYAADVKGVTRVDNQIRIVSDTDLARDEARADAREARADARTERQREVDRANNRATVRNTDIDQNRRTLGDQIDDASITAQLKSSLAVRKSTSALRTEVTTRDGIVTIGGEARNAAEKDLVTKIAENINGVRSVHNEMVVRAQ